MEGNESEVTWGLDLMPYWDWKEGFCCRCGVWVVSESIRLGFNFNHHTQISTVRRFVMRFSSGEVASGKVAPHCTPYSYFVPRNWAGSEVR